MADKFNLGADPEGVIVIKRTGRIRAPHDIIYDPDPHDRIGRATAIGKDGDRDTAAFEFRPGRSPKGEALVNRIGDLCARLHKHYHPTGIVYKAGAYWEPEPMGGHIHFSWEPKPDQHNIYSQAYSDRAWQILECLKGFRTMTEFLTPSLFDPDQVQQRLRFASGNGRDFAVGNALRPNTIEQIMADAHVEFRQPPSWLDCPEAAYCFLGGAEYVVREVFGGKIGDRRDWVALVSRMYSDPGIAPPDSPSLADAFAVARKYIAQADFMPNWVDS